jgi:hypothetical protein
VSELAKRVQARLQALNKTARGASLEAGLGPDAIRLILSGRSKSPQAKNLAAIAAVLEASTQWLLFGDASVTEPGPLGDPDSAVSSPSSRPTGPTKGAALSTVRSYTMPLKVTGGEDGRVTLDIKANVSMGVAAQILALIEGDKA